VEPKPRRRSPPGRQQLLPVLVGQVRGEQAARGGDRHAPTGGGIPACDLLRAPQGNARRQLEAAHLAWGAGQHHSGRAQLRHEVIGKAPLAFRLRRELAGQCGDIARDALDLVCGLNGAELSFVHGDLA
jgi:hypothetical protein